MTFVEKYTILSSLNPFNKLDKDELSVIADACFDYNFKPLECVAQKGSLCMHLFIMSSGSIEYMGKQYKLFSPSKMIAFEEYEENAIANSVEGAMCLVLTRQHFFSIIRKCPKLLVELTNVEEFIK